MAEKKNKTPLYLIDTGSEFYRPLKVRIGVILAAAAWLGIELANRDGFWMVLSGATFAYTVYILLLTYKPPVAVPANPPEADDDERAPAEAADPPRQD